MRKPVGILLSAALLLVGLTGSSVLAQVDLPAKGLFPTFRAGELLLNAPVHIDADKLTYDEDEGVALAEGNVEITLGSRTMRADRIRYDSVSGEAELEGTVRYKDADEEFAFDRIVINLNTETGVLYNGSILIRTNNYRISSRKIEKTGKQSFSMERGSLTTCPCDPVPDWNFEIRRARVVIEGYAHAKDITLRVRGTPVLWLPYAVLPVKLERQSGLLLPGFSSSSSNGFTFSLPYYWAINRWSDATLTVDAMTKRGIRPEAEYRFVPNGDSEGVIRGTFFSDTKIEDERWRVHGENKFHAGDWTLNGHLEIPSDNQYYVDFDVPDALRSARHARSSGFVGHSGPNSSRQLSVVWQEEMEQPSGDNTVQRLPEFSASLLPYRMPAGGVEASGELSATYFYRETGDKSVRGRGTVNLARTFVLYRSVSLTPYAFVNFQATRFEDPAGGRDDAGRAIPAGGVTLAAEAQRGYLHDGEGIVHVVGSNFGFRYVPRYGQESVPVVDRWSRLATQNQFVFNIAQRFLSLKDAAAPREIASLMIEWAYDVGGRDRALSAYVDPLSPYVRVLRDQIDIGANRQTGSGSVSDVYGRLIASPRDRWNIEGEALFDPEDGRFTLGAVGGEWKADDDNRIGAGYRVTRGLAEDIRSRFAWKPLRFLRLEAQMSYSLKNSGLTDGSAGFSLIPGSDCWSVGFVAQRKTQPDDTSYSLVFGLKGIGSVGN